MLTDCPTLKDGGAHSHKMVAHSPLSPARAAGAWNGQAHPQAGPVTPSACLQSPPDPSPPRAGLRCRQASDGGCPAAQGRLRLM